MRTPWVHPKKTSFLKEPWRRLGSLTSTPVTKFPFYLQPSSYHNSTHLASYLVSRGAMRGEKGSQVTEHHGAFSAVTHAVNLKRKQNPCGWKMAPSSVQFSSVQSLSCVWLFATPWIAARQASLSITSSWSSLKLTSIESVMPSSHLILDRPLGSQAKNSAENSCSVASLPFPHAGNSAFQFSPYCVFEACELQPWQAKSCK